MPWHCSRSVRAEIYYRVSRGTLTPCGDKIASAMPCDNGRSVSGVRDARHAGDPETPIYLSLLTMRQHLDRDTPRALNSLSKRTHGSWRVAGRLWLSAERVGSRSRIGTCRSFASSVRIIAQSRSTAAFRFVVSE